MLSSFLLVECGERREKERKRKSASGKAGILPNNKKITIFIQLFENI